MTVESIELSGSLASGTNLTDPSEGSCLSSVLAILSAVTFGGGDFLGGLASRRSRPLRVVAVSQLYGLALSTSLLLVFPPDVYSMTDLGWGVAAGASGGAGLVALYRGLSQARMGVVAPVTAGVGAIVPALYGLATGERPSPLALGGVALALLAILIVGWPASRVDRESPTSRISRGLPDAIAAGAAFGAFFILFSIASDTSGVWPLVGTRLGSLTLLWLLLMVLPGTVSIRRETTPLVLGAGLLDVIANALFLYATRGGLLALVAVLSSLYPAATVMLARVVLHERLSRPQIGGVGLAMAGMAMIAAG